MSTFKRLGLSVLLACGLIVTAAAGVSTGVAAASPFWLDAGSTRFTINGTSKYVQCSVSEASGNASSNPWNITLTFGGTCTTQWSPTASAATSVYCLDPTGTLTLSNFTSTTADVAVQFTRSCTMVIGSNLCTITAPSGASLPWLVPGVAVLNDNGGWTPATLTIPAPTAMPFWASGYFCGLIGVPAYGTATFAPPTGGDLAYTQTGGTPINV